MGYHTQFSTKTTSAPQKKLWDPSKTLGIINNDPAYQCITCIGYVHTPGRRCRMAILKDTRKFILAVMEEIAYLDPESPAVGSRLRTIAGTAVCVRFHQDQEEAVLKQWMTAVKQLKRQAGESERIKPMQDIKNEDSEDDVRQQLRDIKLLLKKLQEQVDGQRHADQTQGRQQHIKKESHEERSNRQAREDKDRESRLKEEQEKEWKKATEAAEEKRRSEQQEKRRQEKARQQKEERDREQEAHNERIRQKAQKAREEKQRQKIERERKEREEWDKLWADYQERWIKFQTSSRDRNLRDAIPWPVKSGLYRDVARSAVEEFMRMGVPRDVKIDKAMRRECQKWHPDRVKSWLRSDELTDVDRMMIDMICTVVTDIMDKAAGKSSDFVD